MEVRILVGIADILLLILFVVYCWPKIWQRLKPLMECHIDRKKLADLLVILTLVNVLCINILAIHAPEMTSADIGYFLLILLMSDVFTVIVGILAVYF